MCDAAAIAAVHLERDASPEVGTIPYCSLDSPGFLPILRGRKAGPGVSRLFSFPTSRFGSDDPGLADGPR